jgi:hypothetical protein
MESYYLILSHKTVRLLGIIICIIMLIMVTILATANEKKDFISYEYSYFQLDVNDFIASIDFL